MSAGTIGRKEGEKGGGREGRRERREEGERKDEVFMQSALGWVFKGS